MVSGIFSVWVFATEEMQREENRNVVKFSDTKAEVDLRSEWLKAISISMTKRNSGQADKVYALLKRKNELTWSSVP